MTGRKLVLAIIWGGGITALAAITPNADLFPLTLLSSCLLLPGWALVALLPRVSGSQSAIAIMAANSLLYSGVAYAVLSIAFRGASVQYFRRLINFSLAPAAALVFISLVPALNPLFPRNLELASEQQHALEAGLPVGIRLEAARNVLNTQRIPVSETLEERDVTVFERGEMRVVAHSGERVLTARLQTQAREFPCGYDLIIVLVFSPHSVLDRRLITTLRTCP